MNFTYKLSDINKLSFDIKNWDIIFLNWDLWSWKTTLSKHIINNLLSVKEDVTSPTYTYYNKYGNNIYHFDLYRLSNYDEFFNIWWEEILDNPDNIIIIEWPDLIKKYYNPTKEIFITKSQNQDERQIKIIP